MINLLIPRKTEGGDTHTNTHTRLYIYISTHIYYHPHIHTHTYIYIERETPSLKSEISSDLSLSTLPFSSI